MLKASGFRDMHPGAEAYAQRTGAGDIANLWNKASKRGPCPIGCSSSTRLKSLPPSCSAVHTAHAERHVVHLPRCNAPAAPAWQAPPTMIGAAYRGPTHKGPLHLHREVRGGGGGVGGLLGGRWRPATWPGVARWTLPLIHRQSTIPRLPGRGRSSDRAASRWDAGTMGH
jgi:hypothetical protein